MSKETSVAAKLERPDLHGENPLCSRYYWRAEVANEDTQLGYWEWVMHRLDEVKGLRYLPAEVARLHDPFDLWGMSHDILEMPEAARFVSVLCAIIGVGRYNSEQWELIAERMCISPETLDEILDLAEKRYGEITKSVEDDNQ